MIITINHLINGMKFLVSIFWCRCQC